MKMITQFPPLLDHLGVPSLRHEYFISSCHPYQSALVISVYVNSTKREEKMNLYGKSTEKNGSEEMRMSRQSFRWGRKYQTGIKRIKKFIKVANHSVEWAFKALILWEGETRHSAFFVVVFGTGWTSERKRKEFLTRKWFHQDCNFRINFNFVCAVICFVSPSCVLHCRSYGFLFVILVKACTASPNCRAEKAINHMRKIKNVESYVYNDTHLLNINNKGIQAS